MSHPQLDALRRVLAGAVVALDFDGTLSPISTEPALAVPQEGARGVLVALSRRVARLAVVTGRPAAFVLGTGGLEHVPGLVVLGHYGAERWAGGVLQVAPPPPGLAQARAALATLPAGAVLEDKGASLAVHTRTAVDPVALLASLGPELAELAERTGLQCRSGRLVLELGAAEHDKGRALRSLLDPMPTAVLYAGDDVGDLPAFAALAALTVPVLRVCSDSTEAPAALRDQADLVVAGPAGVVGLLRALLD